MKGIKFFSYIAIFQLLFPLIIYAQEADPVLEKLYLQARREYNRGNFVDAANQYKDLVDRDPNSFLYNYELGLLCFYELNNKKSSIRYFNSAIDNMKDTIIDIYNYLGQAYQANLEYDKAIEIFQLYSSIPPKPGVIKISMKRYISQCIDEKNKIEKIAKQRENISESGIQVVNAGHVVNSEYSDYSPRFVDKSSLIFTSAREFDYQFEVYIHKPYIATRESNLLFNKVSKLADSDKSEIVFDPEWHTIITDFTPDLKKVFYMYEELIYMREGQLDQIIEPLRLPKEINQTRRSSSATVSTDGLRLIYSLYDKKLKRWDLYQSTRQNDGVWRKGEKIETLSSDRDEQYPFLSEDGYTLYFSSTGHNSSGGYDIFKSTLKENNEWSTPERLAEPINSADNDVWFSISPDGKRGLFSSDRKGGFGNYDIYEVSF
ncbi:MAG: hypothetical protein PHW19_00575 [Salinivirgaceae bacterium]|nr:hypothetical protein [Salinivirgaceae bacterium]